MNSCTEYRQLGINFIAFANNWWKIFYKIIGVKTLDEILDVTGAREKRNRKLPAKIMMMLSIAMNIFTEESISDVFSTMMENIRYQHPDLDVDDEIPKKGLFVRLDTGSESPHWWLCFVKYVAHYQKSSGSILIKAGETTGTIAVNLLSSPMEDGISLNITPTEFTNAYALSTATIETTQPSLPPVVVSPQNSSSGGHNIFDNATSSRIITASSAAASSAAAMTGLQMTDLTSNLRAENIVEEMLNPEEKNQTEAAAQNQTTTITGSQSAPQGNRAISRSQNRSITSTQPEQNMTDHNTRTEAADYADSGLEDDFSGAV